MLLLSLLKAVELGPRTVKPDLLRRGVDEIDRHEATAALTKAWFDHEVGERTRDGVDDHPLQFSAGAVAAEDFASNIELRGLTHACRPSFACMFAPAAATPLPCGASRRCSAFG